MALDGLFTGADESFETWFTSIGAGTMFGGGVLTDGKTQKIKANLILIGSEGVGHGSFAWFQAQPHFG